MRSREVGESGDGGAKDLGLETGARARAMAGAGIWVSTGGGARAGARAGADPGSVRAQGRGWSPPRGRRGREESCPGAILDHFGDFARIRADSRGFARDCPKWPKWHTYTSFNAKEAHDLSWGVNSHGFARRPPAAK